MKKKTTKSEMAVKTKAALRLVNLKCSAADIEVLEEKARRHADGNLSAWLRHSGKRYTPKKGERVRTYGG